MSPERCPSCRRQIDRPRNQVGGNGAIIDPPPDLTRYLAVWAFNHALNDLPEMAARIRDEFMNGDVLVFEEVGTT